MNTISIFSILALLLAFASGCTTRSAARERAREAYYAGRAAEAEQEKQEQQPSQDEPTVRVVGNVTNTVLPWRLDLTLARAIIESGYQGGDPKQIVLYRGGKTTYIDPGELLRGNDMQLLPQDSIEIKP